MLRLPSGWEQYPCRVNGRRSRVARRAWVKANGPIPEGLMVLHACNNGLCDEIHHLFLGTNSDNMEHAVASGRQLGAMGLNNGAHTHPERRSGGRLFGAKNPRYTHPESTARGERHGSAKLTNEQASVIRDLRGITRADVLAETYGISKVSVYKIWNGDSYAD